MHYRAHKIYLLVLMLATYLPAPAFAYFAYQAIDPSPLRLIGAICGMSGVVLLTWQYLLGVRGLVSKLIPDLLWINRIHQFLGKYGFLLIVVHPILMIAHYLTLGVNIILPSLATQSDQFRVLGEAAILILSITWIASAIFRGRISFRMWKRIHVFNLIVLPMVLAHSLALGTTLQFTELRYYWYGIASVATLVLIYRFLLFTRLGFNRYHYTVTAVHKIQDHTVEIDMAPKGRILRPAPGQFVYIQHSHSREAHPFTASRFNESTGEISITPKCSGPFSCGLQDIQLYDTVWLDGPYGVFTREVYTTGRPVVLIAGGIGITPFVRIIERLQQGWDKDVHLFYANHTTAEIAYADLVDAAVVANPRFRAIHVMSRQTDFPGERGYVDASKIKQYLAEHPAEYEYFVCGPPPMMRAVIGDLRGLGVPAVQIFSEKFSL